MQEVETSCNDCAAYIKPPIFFLMLLHPSLDQASFSSVFQTNTEKGRESFFFLLKQLHILVVSGLRVHASPLEF